MRCSRVAARRLVCLVVSAILLGGLAIGRQGTAGAATSELPVCERAGVWLDPASGAHLQAPDLMKRLADRKVVLLGESHTALEHHRWQLHTLAGLSAHAPVMAVGFEMFPRSVQTALDEWSQGELSEKAFLTESRWAEVWGYEPAAYLPLFHFARQGRIPMAALNVDRALISRVGREGWGAIAEDEREGLSDPAPAEAAYLESLAEVFRAKIAQGRGRHSSQPGQTDAAASGEGDAIPEVAEILKRDDFRRFVEAQLTWDRAMAEALFEMRQANPEALVVGVLGRGHAEYGYGVPHQLADLGERDVAVLLPVETGSACDALVPGVADAVFLVGPDLDEADAPAKPRLGVVIETTENGVAVQKVVPGSVAAAAELAPGDVILRAAELPVARNAELIEIIQRQAPGTWLPLDIRRDGEERQLLAKFPALTNSPTENE